jgi:hypothetical protein
MIYQTELSLILVESERIRGIVASTHQIIAKARALLCRPVPSSFLGRKTQDPFPQETGTSTLGPTDEDRHASQVPFVRTSVPRPVGLDGP